RFEFAFRLPRRRLGLVDLRVLVHPRLTRDRPLHLLAEVPVRAPVRDRPRVALAHRERGERCRRYPLRLPPALRARRRRRRLRHRPYRLEDAVTSLAVVLIHRHATSLATARASVRYAAPSRVCRSSGLSPPSPAAACAAARLHASSPGIPRATSQASAPAKVSPAP